eukprot:4577463-Pleurochrysis_carterae.AAC.5
MGKKTCSREIESSQAKDPHTHNRHINLSTCKVNLSLAKECSGGSKQRFPHTQKVQGIAKIQQHNTHTSRATGTARRVSSKPTGYEQANRNRGEALHAKEETTKVCARVVRRNAPQAQALADRTRESSTNTTAATPQNEETNEAQGNHENA